MRNTFLYAIASLILLISCKTNPPSSPDLIEPDLGKIYVNANIYGALIFLDDNNTGKVTPDTVEATVGEHEIRLQKDNYANSSQNVEVIKDSIVTLTFMLQSIVAKLVLLEDFANVSCTPCVVSNKIIESIKSYTYGHSKLVVIKYPTNFPSPNDPFYLANSPDCNARINYYSIFSAPTMIIDGTMRPISTDSISVKDSIDHQLQQPSKFYIAVNDSTAGSNLFITVMIRVVDGNGLDFSKIVLHTVVTETEIEFSTPPGSNGETEFYDVMRKMLPTNAGESLDGISQTEEVSFQRQTSINPIWVVNKLHTVAFIQNIDTKEVYQAASTFE